MRNKSSILLVTSLILAVMVSGVAWVWLKSNGPAKPQQTVSMWVAKETIPPGMVIKSEMIVQKTVEGDLPPGLLNSAEDIQGKTTKDSILKGEGFPVERILSEDDRMLSMRLPDGHRAYAISVTQYSAVADLLRAGDRIDVFVFLSEIEKDQVVIRPDIASLLLQNIEILSVRKELSASDEKPEELTELYTLTLSVPVKDIEKLVFGAEKGVLKVALRPANATDTFDSYGVIWQELLLDPALNIREMFPEYNTVNDPNVINSAILKNPVVPVKEPAESEPVVQAADTTPSQKKYTLYTVKYGDSLMSISRDFFKGNASYYDDIMRMNKLPDQIINPGQTLRIPLSGR